MKLEVKNIHKSFSDVKILKDISFEVESGKAMGFLGRNGAGKTTTLRALMGVFRQDQGEFILDGKIFRPEDYKVGYLPEERGMYPKEEIAHQLEYFGKLRGGDKNELRRNIDYWLDRVDLSAYKKKKLETLSKGNQQKIQIVQSLVTNPDIVILDEPFSGLDPVNSMVLKDIIVELISENKLVIFSSHQMSYVEEFCDEITLINQGEIVLTGNLSRIKVERGKNRIRMSADKADEPMLMKALSPFGETHIREDKTSYIVHIPGEDNPSVIMRKLLEAGVEVTSFSPYLPSLTEIFVETAGDKS
ncbi:ABC transporter ATP-binding protein [Proteiniclasticum sp. C24MP]|uniref:ABC transporter ATP-binding protein n=1 Tax=Proteiniclasticum sp. C24MP TaxID=3374101 RepID=UPI003754ECA0